MTAGSDFGESYEALAKNAFKDKNYANVLHYASIAINLNPENTVLLALRGRANWALKRYDSAIADYTKILKIKPDNKVALKWRANAYRLQFLFERADADFTRLLEIEPDDQFALKYAARVKLKLHCNGSAVALLSKVFCAKFETSELFLAQLGSMSDADKVLGFNYSAQACVVKNWIEAALRFCNRALELEPSNFDALLFRAECYFSQEKYNLVIEACDVLLLQAPDDLEVLALRSEAKLMLGQDEEAAVDCDTALARSPGTVAFLITRAQAAANLGQHEKAISDLELALGRDSDNQLALELHGSYLSAAGKYDKAFASLSRLLELNPENPEALRTCGSIAYVQRRCELALNFYRRRLRLRFGESEDKATTYLDMAEANIDLREYETALEWVERALKLAEPKTLLRARGYLARAFVTLNQAQYADTIKDCNLVLVILPNNSTALFCRAYAHFEKKDSAAARKDYARLAVLDPQFLLGRIKLESDKTAEHLGELDIDVELLSSASAPGGVVTSGEVADGPQEDTLFSSDLDRCLFLAQLDLESSDWDSAVTNFTSALALDPENTVALAGRGRAYCNTRLYQDALDDLSRAQELDPTSVDELLINAARLGRSTLDGSGAGAGVGVGVSAGAGGLFADFDAAGVGAGISAGAGGPLENSGRDSPESDMAPPPGSPPELDDDESEVESDIDGASAVSSGSHASSRRGVANLFSALPPAPMHKLDPADLTGESVAVDEGQDPERAGQRVALLN